MSIKSFEMLLYDFPQSLDINPCPRTIVCNTCELIHMSGDIFNADENVRDEDEYGFTGSFFKTLLITMYENVKIQLMRMHRTPKSNNDEQLLNNKISENIDEKRIN